MHTGWSAYNHLRRTRADTWHPEVARERPDRSRRIARRGAQACLASSPSGMGQRLGIASALLGDPDTIILFLPAGQRARSRRNSLDPKPAQGLAAEGRTVFVSSPLDERDGQTDRRPPDRDRPGTPDRRHQRRSLHRHGIRQACPGPNAKKQTASLTAAWPSTKSTPDPAYVLDVHGLLLAAGRRARVSKRRPDLRAPPHNRRRSKRPS